jgi:hypothetical protein
MAWTVDVATQSGSYVIRAEPWNQRQEGLQSNWGTTNRFLERLFTRNHSWTVRVRERQDDPFGRVQYAENVAKRSEVPEVLRRVEDALRRGVRPNELRA